MSRLGKIPVEVPAGVKVVFSQNKLQVEGPKGKLSMLIPQGIGVQVDAGRIITNRASDSGEMKACHGMVRSSVANMVRGVSSAFEIKLLINGVGYRAAMKGQTLNLTLGFSHPVNFDLPKEITCKVEGNTTVVLSSADKALLGDVCAKIRAIRPPEPYQGKGIKYSDEVIRRKAGKAAATSK
jgi:large subunit ribosomal protein L6